MRCFVALDFPLEINREIIGIQEKIRKKGLFFGKFTEDTNLHLTLKFLGEVPEEKIPEIKKRLSEIHLDSPISAELGETGVFNKKIVRIIWIKLNGSQIFKLQKLVDEKLLDIFPKEEQFMSHITLARVKNASNKAELFQYLESIKPRKIKFKIDSFSLKSSELLESGPIYTDIEAYNLGK